MKRKETVRHRRGKIERQRERERIKNYVCSAFIVSNQLFSAFNLNGFNGVCGVQILWTYGHVHRTLCLQPLRLSWSPQWVHQGPGIRSLRLSLQSRSSLKWQWHHVLLYNTTHGFLMISVSMLISSTTTYQDLPGPTRTDHPPGSPTSGRTQRATWPWSDLKRGVSSNPCAQRDPTSPGEWYPERQLSELSGVKRPEQFGHLSAWVAGTDILRQLI